MAIIYSIHCIESSEEDQPNGFATSVRMLIPLDTYKRDIWDFKLYPVEINCDHMGQQYFLAWTASMASFTPPPSQPDINICDDIAKIVCLFFPQENDICQ